KVVDAEAVQGPYACLSYCWGDSRNLQTTKSTLQERRRGISWTSIPKTLQDAIEITRSLGMGHIWIDALCIIQDDDADWRSESARMGHIYANAELTIAATWGSDAQTGIHKNRSETVTVWQRQEFAAASTKTSLGDSPIFARRRFVHDNIGLSPLCQRGWTLQEHILSRRIVHFTEQEAWFACREQDANCECQYGRPVMPMFVRPANVGMIPVTRMWRTIVQNYSYRELTNPSDKLSALAGTAQMLHQKAEEQRLPLGRYLAGLWNKTFRKDLLWFVSRSSACEFRHAERYRAPSWSWASVNGQI
ncbi:heterokaryon incompatibility protein-domain-containing protein, partial [Lasiosphaeria miniovina]